MRAILLAVAGLVGLVSVAQAQLSLTQIEEQLTGRADELVRVEQLLSAPDPNKRIAAMELLLSSGDPQFVYKAREFGLLSDDRAMRQAAVRAILTAGGAFRLTVEAPTKESTDLERATRHFAAAIDNTGRRSFTFVIAEGFDEASGCWRAVTRNDVCSLVATGDTVQLGNGWHVPNHGRVTGEFQLDDQGALAGYVFSGSGKPLSARIPLLD